MTDSTAGRPPEVAVYLNQAGIIRKRVHTNLEGFTHEESLVQPKPAGHSGNWILGHLIEIYERMLPRLGQDRVLSEEVLEPYRQGSPAREDPSRAVDLSQLLAAWDEVNDRIDDGLRGLTAGELERTDTYFRMDPEPTTLRRYLDVILFHQAYHAGQLGLLRRLQAKDGAVP